MKKKFFQVTVCILVLTIVTLSCFSCVKINNELGRNYLAIDQQYDIYTTSFKIRDVQMCKPDSLSAFSVYKFAFGSLRDDTFGLTSRAAAFTLVPVSDSLDFGKPGTREFHQFHFSGAADNVSYADETQKDIIQNVYVYEVEKPFTKNDPYPEVTHGKKIITDGIPLYSGKDSLSFNFSKEFGEKFMHITSHDMDTITNYIKKFPGIYICTDKQEGIGGRINIFKLPLGLKEGRITGSYATLKFAAEYDERGKIDTTFYFYLGPGEIYDLHSTFNTDEYRFPQFALGISEHESDGKKIDTKEEFYLEGGRGLKPVIKAAPVRKELIKRISEKGDPEKAIICKATIELPCVKPDNYKNYYQMPEAISPTCRIKIDGKTKFAGITDSSVKSENQGEINRSKIAYEPDMSYHIQELLRADEKNDDYSNYDIWFLAMATEIVNAEQQQSDAQYDEMMRDLAYANYYNNMYGGYGGYGYGRYGGGYGYNNYYNFMMMSQMYNRPNKQKQVKKMLMDPERYYRTVFKGTKEKDGPKFTVTYAIPKEYGK